jgi:hypothetical protein
VCILGGCIEASPSSTAWSNPLTPSAVFGRNSCRPPERVICWPTCTPIDRLAHLALNSRMRSTETPVYRAHTVIPADRGLPTSRAASEAKLADSTSRSRGRPRSPEPPPRDSRRRPRRGRSLLSGAPDRRSPLGPPPLSERRTSVPASSISPVATARPTSFAFSSSEGVPPAAAAAGSPAARADRFMWRAASPRPRRRP